MSAIATINSRKLYYQKYNPDQSWVKNIPGKKWVLVALADSEDKMVFQDISRNAIYHDVYCVSCAGSCGEALHDWIDNEIVARQVGVLAGHLPMRDIVTTWHNEGLGDALWYALHCTDDAGDVLMLDASDKQIEPNWKEIIAEWEQIELYPLKALQRGFFNGQYRSQL